MAQKIYFKLFVPVNACAQNTLEFLSFSQRDYFNKVLQCWLVKHASATVLPLGGGRGLVITFCLENVEDFLKIH